LVYAYQLTEWTNTYTASVYVLYILYFAEAERRHQYKYRQKYTQKTQKREKKLYATANILTHTQYKLVTETDCRNKMQEFLDKFRLL